MRRTLITFMLAVAALAVVAAPAMAVTSTQTLKAKILPTTAGTSSKPRNISLTVEPVVTLNPADAPFATRKAVIYLDKNLKFGGSKLATCTAAKAALGTCPSASKVGIGTAKGQALGIPENLTIVAYNADKGKSILMRVKGSAPLQIDTVMVGKLSTGSGAYGNKLTVPIPDELQQPAPGAFATLLDFKLTVKAGSRTTPYVGLKGCTKGGLKFKGTFTYTDGTSQSPTTTAACKS